MAEHPNENRDKHEKSLRAQIAARLSAIDQRLKSVIDNADIVIIVTDYERQDALSKKEH